MGRVIQFAKKKLQILREELRDYAPKERLFLLFAALSCFFVCCNYAIVRPIANSLFIEVFGARLFPYAWLMLVPLNFVCVSLYNRLLPKWGSTRLLISLVSIVAALNALFALTFRLAPAITFAFYMWKEIYILLLFQLVWSLTHANVKLSRAKYLYGAFFGFGGLGSLLGSAVPGFFAVRYGTEALLFLTLPFLLLLLLSYWKMGHYSTGEVPHHEREESGGMLHGVRLIRGSRFLIFTLLIVVFMQMIAAVTDFQLQDFLGKTFPQKDVRTEYTARIMGIIHALTVVLQFLGSYLLIQIVGFKRCHYLVPLSLAAIAALFLTSPTLAFVSLSFITCKTLDFSIFGVIKEMLYVPLKPDEQFRAKAVIDVFAYRTSKALASVMIILATSFFSAISLTWFTLLLTLLWMGSVSFGLREFETLTRIPHQEGGYPNSER